MRVAHLPQRHGINEIDVPRHERGEGRLGIIPGVFAQPHNVVVRHFTHIIYAGVKRQQVIFCLKFYPANASKLKKSNSNQKLFVIFENIYCVPVRIG
jgi:hypothetical protein